MTAPAERIPPAGQNDDGNGADRHATWWRGGSMLLFVIAFSLAQTLHTALAVVQFLSLLVLGEPNRHIAGFGASLSEWTRATSRFLTCAGDEAPWPLAPWPAPRD